MVGLYDTCQKAVSFPFYQCLQKLASSKVTIDLDEKKRGRGCYFKLGSE